MNRTKLKNYSPQARRDFIQAMTDRAAFFGLTAKKIEPVVERGDLAVIAARAFPKSIAQKRKQLEDRIKRHGFEQTMEALAYTWFNRLVAIRFMELHGYLDHGYRVLSHPEGKPTPEILEHAEHVELPGLKPETAIDLKMAGNKEAELYRLLLTAQCNALHDAMPFLFEKIDDETELLLPDNLLHSDSLIRKLVNEIDEEDWQEVEIIGWLYQFYISEKKAEVIGKVVASEDIPAATQLFTPNWIVKYLVQNTLGRQWLATYPQSSLRQQMEYYIEPAEQTPEVQEQLKAITPTSLNPEELTLLDPACGSGHILVEAYDMFKAIYQERGYRAKDIPALILEKNLFGLETDDRAEQLAAFSLLMKARADDRRILESEAKPHVLAFENSQGMNAADITHALNSPINKEELPPSEYLFEEIENEDTPLFSRKTQGEKEHVSQGDIVSLLALFENAKTFGSLIEVPPKLAAKVPEIERRLKDVLKHGDLTHAPAHVLKPLLQQARFLARQYDAVAANPPYLSDAYQTDAIKTFLGEKYCNSDKDVFAAFIVRGHRFLRTDGRIGVVCPFVWMFLASFELLRLFVIRSTIIESLIQLETNAFEPAMVTVCAFVCHSRHTSCFQGAFIRLSDFKGAVNQPLRTLEAIRNRSCGWFYNASSDSFEAIPGSPISYWLSWEAASLFEANKSIGDVAVSRKGMATGDNDRFVRFWYEVPFPRIGFGLERSEALRSGLQWFPYANGGPFRKWCGNLCEVVNWHEDGRLLRTERHSSGRIHAVNLNLDFVFREGITWTSISSAFFCVRHLPKGCLFSSASNSLFAADKHILPLMSFLNSPVAAFLTKAINPTLNANPGDTAKLPVLLDDEIIDVATQLARDAMRISKEDWDSHENSWDFSRNPIVGSRSEGSVKCAYLTWASYCNEHLQQLTSIEKQNRELWKSAYKLDDKTLPPVPEDQVTLHRPDREEDIKRLLSYAIGCMMGRYSLDTPRVIYAHSGNQGFDPSQYTTFRADHDGIIPLLETDWGIRDDAANRIVEFIGVAWPKERLEENLTFIADSLGSTSNEQPRDTIRRYLATGFYKHHLSMYKKRPIYWLFSSGKRRAFQCLVYLHRYHEGTLARMRTEYVIPLQGQIAARIEQLEGDKAKATSTSHRNRLQKEQDNLKKQQAELLTFEEKLKHAAEQKISLDLDDGVRVNYAKFGDLLAESKAITGGKDEE